MVDLGAVEVLEKPIGECRGTRTAPGERENDEIFLGPEILLARLECIPTLRVDLSDRRIDRAGRAAAKNQQRGERRRESPCKPLMMSPERSRKESECRSAFSGKHLPCGSTRAATSSHQLIHVNSLPARIDILHHARRASRDRRIWRQPRQ